ncbi:TIGR01841 family phasin [uncultured Cohaesibacter sp.]|uniref:phasin family protein n=1 Tax=uncultured Cohaesibacter sp. TaxID=1002546 RepID=UPI0029C8C168|nr:TIGR01841 family phasin [uncultured Cohaesibacter sp.]
MTVAPKKTPIKRTAAKTATASAPVKKEAPADAVAKPVAEAEAKVTATAEAPKAKAAPEAAEVAASIAYTQFDLSSLFMPDAARELAEKSIASARDGYEKSREAFEDQKASIETSINSATASARDLNKKTLEAANEAMTSGFSLMTDMLAAKTVSEAIELQTAFASKQFETMTAQGRDFQETMSKSFEDITAPFKTAADKTMAMFKTH